ncbi:hypothetical protein D3C85_1898490 [compost metagenome]
MPNSSGSNRRQLRSSAVRDSAVGRISPSAMPEIMNSNGMRQRLSTSIGHCSQSDMWLLLMWNPQSAT